MEAFPAHVDRKFVKIIKIITVFGFPILGPISGPIFPLWAALFSLCGLFGVSFMLLAPRKKDQDNQRAGVPEGPPVNVLMLVHVEPRAHNRAHNRA